MASDSVVYKSQNVNYLGFLEAQLRDLTGIATLAYELIQNADDVQDDNGRSSTTYLSFDITDTALIVENNGVFRPVDFERLQNLAGGGKREEAGTTGAFGIGFVAVYQITDAPEIFSNGLHWTIRPDAVPEQRIQERKVTTTGTCFRLPWAFDTGSSIRRTLRMEAIQPDQLDGFATTIASAIETAALFLQQIEVLEVKRNGRLLQCITRKMPVTDRIVLQDMIGTTTWMLIQGDFAAEAGKLREQFPWQIEEFRRSSVRVAVPAAGLDGPGRLFAVLPTDSTTPLPFHMNADFYPTTDRKRIHFGSGYQAAWNQAAINCAADTLAQQFDTWPQLLGPGEFWHLLQKMAYTQQMANEGELPQVFVAFWQTVAPVLHSRPIVFTAGHEWRLPAEVRLPGRGIGETAVSLLTSLNICLIHPDLNSHSQLMQRPEIGAVNLAIQDVIDALAQAGIVGSMPLLAAPLFLRTVAAWQLLWDVIDRLLAEVLVPQEREAALDTLRQCGLVLTEAMTLDQLHRVHRGKPEAKLLFPDAVWMHEAVPVDRFPGRFAQNFGARQAVELLAEMPPDQLEYAWRIGRLDLPALFRWFESQQIEIFADDPVLQQEIRRLPLVPVNGELRPLSHLYLPGGFEDPLGLSSIIDLDAIGGRPQFLHDLGVQELDFETYVHDQLPRTLTRHPDIPSDARQSLVQLLAERLGEFRDDELLQIQLSGLPLIACLDGSFRAANTVYASRDVQKLLGEGVHIAEPVERKSIKALHRWLGVRDEPAAADIVQSLLEMSQAWEGIPLDESAQRRLRRCLLRLNSMIAAQITYTALSPLQEKKVLPNRNWRLVEPTHIFVVDQAEMVERFTELDECLLVIGEGIAQITAVLGIQPLSKAAKLQVMDALDAIEDVAVQERIAARRPLIDRILQAEAAISRRVFDTNFLENMRVLKLPDLQIQYWLAVGSKVLKTEPEPVSVKFDADINVLYLADYHHGISWATVARELAAAIKGNAAVGGLAIGIKEVLAAKTFGMASHILDESGYL